MVKNTLNVFEKYKHLFVIFTKQQNHFVLHNVLNYKVINLALQDKKKEE